MKTHNQLAETSDSEVLDSKRPVTLPPPRLREHQGKMRQRTQKSKRSGSSPAKLSLLVMVFLMPSQAHCHCGALDKIRPNTISQGMGGGGGGVHEVRVIS